MTRRNRSLDEVTLDSDLALFDLIVRDVKPLKSTRRAVDSDRRKRETDQSIPKNGAKEVENKSYAADLGSDLKPEHPPILISKHPSGKVPGVDRRTALKLKRGKFYIEGKIDLHGMDREEARAALVRFIEYSFQASRRTLLVITGKGNRKNSNTDKFVTNSQGVLRRMLPIWLSKPPIAGQVLAFSAAQPEHGGTGAFYVLLKRKRRL